MSATSAEPCDARIARDCLRAALIVADGPLGDACAALDASEVERLEIALRAAKGGDDGAGQAQEGPGAA